MSNIPTLEELYESLEFSEESIGKVKGRELNYVLFHFYRYTYNLLINYLPYYRIHIGDNELNAWDEQVERCMKQLDYAEEFVTRSEKEYQYAMDYPEIIARCREELSVFATNIIESVKNNAISDIKTFKRTIKNHMEKNR